VEAKAKADLMAGREANVIREVPAEIPNDRFNERLRDHLMRALYRAGRAAEAVDVYFDFAQLLEDERGMRPSRELQQLHQDIQRQELQDDYRPIGIRSPAAPAIPPDEITTPEELFVGREPELQRLRDALAAFTGGTLIVAILGVPFKCPPAPYEGALLIHEYLMERGVRDVTDIQVVSPMGSPIPVSAEASAAIVLALAERGIGYTPGHRVTALDPSAHVARLATGDRPYDLFVGVPVHRVPAVVAESGLTKGGNDGWAAVNPRTLATPFPGVYALGDCADAPVPRAGVFAENAARVVADQIAAAIRGSGPTDPYNGQGSCYVEFGEGLVGKLDADFLSGPSPSAPFLGPSLELATEKARFAATRRQRWFGT